MTRFTWHPKVPKLKRGMRYRVFVTFFPSLIDPVGGFFLSFNTLNHGFCRHQYSCNLAVSDMQLKWIDVWYPKYVKCMDYVILICFVFQWRLSQISEHRKGELHGWRHNGLHQHRGELKRSINSFDFLRVRHARKERADSERGGGHNAGANPTRSQGRRRQAHSTSSECTPKVTSFHFDRQQAIPPMLSCGGSTTGSQEAGQESRASEQEQAWAPSLQALRWQRVVLSPGSTDRLLIVRPPSGNDQQTSRQSASCCHVSCARRLGTNYPTWVWLRSWR